VDEEVNPEETKDCMRVCNIPVLYRWESKEERVKDEKENLIVDLLEVVSATLERSEHDGVESL
jgi:hypothetical protein